MSQMNEYGDNMRPFFFLINYDQNRIYVGEPDTISKEEILYSIGDYTNTPECVPAGGCPERPVWQPSPQPVEKYAEAFNKVQAQLYAGNSYLVNLTCSTPVKTDLTLKEIYTKAQAPYKVYLQDSFVCFSPETFIRIRDGYIYSYPMKGTRDASIPGAKEELLNDPKESAEHATITDLIRNDLSQVSEQVEVSRYRYIDEIRTNRGPLLQMSSEIRGKLQDD